MNTITMSNGLITTPGTRLAVLLASLSTHDLQRLANCWADEGRPACDWRVLERELGKRGIRPQIVKDSNPCHAQA